MLAQAIRSTFTSWIRRSILRLLGRCPRFFLLEAVLQQPLTEMDEEFVGDLLPATRKIVVGEERTPGLFWSLFWQLASCGRLNTLPRTVAMTVGDRDLKIRVDLSKAPECCYYFNDPNPQLSHILSKGGRTMIDAGANAGFFTIVASATFSKVVAFEPTPSTFKRLSANVELNALSNVVAVQKALGDALGSSLLYMDPCHPGGNSLCRQDGSRTHLETTSIDVTTLDDYVEKNSLSDIDFIKIDVEGFEMPMLRGALRTVETCRPRIYVEIHDYDITIAFFETLPAGYRLVSGKTGETVDIYSPAFKRQRPRDLLFEPL